MATNGNGNGGVGAVWKTIALVLVTILITGTPGIVYALRTWSLADESAIIRERQDDVRARIATLEARQNGLQDDIDQLNARLEALINRTP